MQHPTSAGPHRAPPSTRGLRIGVDGTCLASQRGYGRFLRELLPPLLEFDRANEYVLFVDRHTAARLGPLPLRVVEPATSVGQAEAASARGSRSLRDLWTMGRAVAREPLDLMYFPSVYSYFPVPGRVPVVVAFHDIIAERHARIVFPTLRTRWLWRAKVALALRRARAIITVSEWSRASLAERFRIPAERIFVTLEAPAAVFRPVADPGPRRAWLRKRGLPEAVRYLIYVGGFNPHKDVGTLVEAFAALVKEERGRDLHLLLVGDHADDVFHSDVAGLRARIARAGVGERVCFTGYVGDPELRDLYAGAVALVLPSLEEGFGLPAVEAAACGTPCVATCRSPLPQLLEGGGLFVEPSDAAALRSALARLIGDPSRRRELSAAALEAANRLSWRSTAEATRRALEWAAGAST